MSLLSKIKDQISLLRAEYIVLQHFYIPAMSLQYDAGQVKSPDKYNIWTHILGFLCHAINIQRNLCQWKGWDWPYVQYGGAHDGKLPHNNLLSQNFIKILAKPSSSPFTWGWLVEHILRGFPAFDLSPISLLLLSPEAPQLQHALTSLMIGWISIQLMNWKTYIFLIYFQTYISNTFSNTGGAWYFDEILSAKNSCQIISKFFSQAWKCTGPPLKI